MFSKFLLTSYKNKGSLLLEFSNKSKHLNSHIAEIIADMVFVGLLIMSLKIITVSSKTTEFYQNQTEALFIQTGLFAQPNSTQKPADQQFQLTNNLLQRQPTQFRISSDIGALERNLNKTNESMTDTTWEIMEQQTKVQPLAEHILRANAHLLERDNDDSAGKNHGKRFPGTWCTKVRRAHSASMPIQNSIVSTADLKVNHKMTPYVNENGEFQPKHIQERKQRHMSTVCPRGSPPRSTARHPSFLMRRNHVETPYNAIINEPVNPKPFHFPFDGPMPEKFIKAEDGRNGINSIQDILQHLHLTGSQPPVPPMMMMPTGLHIAGSFKNLKSSGIENIFRNKRTKKHDIQHIIQTPMPAPMHTSIHTPQQRITMDQIYPFKPRSPNDINLLAMHQQLTTNRNKNKKKSKKLPNSNNLILQHSNIQIPFVVEPYAQFYPQLAAPNVTHKPEHKRLPFKVNLDIFPVLPLLRNVKAGEFVPEYIKVPPSSSPTTSLRNPFVDYNPYASTASLLYGRYRETPAFAPHKYHTNAQMLAESSNMHSTNPDAKIIYKPARPQPQMYNMQRHRHKSQQQQQQQQNNLLRQQKQQPKNHKFQQQVLRSYSQPYINSQTHVMPTEWIFPSSSNIITHANNKQVNPIMVHLNVFPKSQKTADNPSQGFSRPYQSQ